jgi:hypothetical protein
MHIVLNGLHPQPVGGCAVDLVSVYELLAERGTAVGGCAVDQASCR